MPVTTPLEHRAHVALDRVVSRGWRFTRGGGRAAAESDWLVRPGNRLAADRVLS